MPAAQTALVSPSPDRPDAPALIFEGAPLSFRELDEAVARAACVLAAQGIGKGAAFAVLSENRPEVMVAYYAAARLGAVFIPINPSLMADEVSYVVEHSDALLLFHDEVMAPIAEAAVDAARLRSVALLATADAPPVATGEIDPDADFLIIYTSGSTGRPKAVVFDQTAEVAGNAALIDMWAITPQDRLVVGLPLGFLYGLSTASSMALQARAEVILLRKFSPARALDAITTHRATVFQGVPTMFAMMLDYVEENDLDIDLSFMRLLICAGAPLPQELRQRFVARFGKAIDDYYALTEVRPVFGRDPRDPSTVPAGAIGKAAPGAVIRVIDETGKDVPNGETGELLVRAAGTLTRYHKSPDLTDAALRDGLFVTGDIGYRDAQGYYYLTGRIKDIIIRGGANIAPAEVEDALLSHPDVRAAAVVGRSDPMYGEVPFAFIVPRDPETCDGASVIAHCRARLADFKVPAGMTMLAELPLGITGKVDKAALKTRLESEA